VLEAAQLVGAEQVALEPVDLAAVATAIFVVVACAAEAAIALGRSRL
jgi:hypothetical protein